MTSPPVSTARPIQRPFILTSASCPPVEAARTTATINNQGPRAASAASPVVNHAFGAFGAADEPLSPPGPVYLIAQPTSPPPTISGGAGPSAAHAMAARQAAYQGSTGLEVDGNDMSDGEHTPRTLLDTSCSRLLAGATPSRSNAGRRARAPTATFPRAAAAHMQAGQAAPRGSQSPTPTRQRSSAPGPAAAACASASLTASPSLVAELTRIMRDSTAGVRR